MTSGRVSQPRTEQNVRRAIRRADGAERVVRDDNVGACGSRGRHREGPRIDDVHETGAAPGAKSRTTRRDDALRPRVVDEREYLGDRTSTGREQAQAGAMTTASSSSPVKICSAYVSTAPHTVD